MVFGGRHPERAVRTEWGMQEAAEEAMARAMQDAGGCGVGLGSDGRIALRQGYCHARGRRPISGGDCA